MLHEKKQEDNKSFEAWKAIHYSNNYKKKAIRKQKQNEIAIQMQTSEK